VKAARSRLGWLGPVIVLVGVAVAALGIWYMIYARPKPGDVFDTIAIDPESQFVIRAEAGSGERSFLELVHNGETVWQALIPRYAGAKGRPGIAWSDIAVTVRVDRSGRAEVFALSMHDSTKIGGFRLAPDHAEAISTQSGPITLTDHTRSYEFVGGETWHELVAVELRTGKALWKADLGHWAVQDAGLQTPYIWVVQANQKRWFYMLSGVENRSLN
jgi:hypothetical protein